MAARLVCEGSVVRSAVSCGRVVAVAHQADAVEHHLDVAGGERDVGGAGAIGIDRADRAGADVAARLIVEREQALVARAGRERWIAFVEGQRRLGVRQRLGDDRAHARLGAVELRRRQRPQIAHHDRLRGDDVLLARRGAARQRDVEIGGRAAEDHARD